jgi:hypothetical protein
VRAEATLSLLALLGLGMACEEPRSFECANPDQVQEIDGVHYEDLDCDAAIQTAEARLTTAYYRKACEQLAPSEGVPDRVTDAHVAHCQPAEEGGSIVDILLCCP